MVVSNKQAETPPLNCEVGFLAQERWGEYVSVFGGSKRYDQRGSYEEFSMRWRSGCLSLLIAFRHAVFTD